MSRGMTPGAGIAWTPGERLVTAFDDEPSCEVSSWSAPAPFVKLFFQGHLHFMARTPALDRSRDLRAAILECLSDLPANSPHASDLRDAHTVWSFMEAVYLVDPAFDSSHVSTRLADWYSLNYPQLYGEARGILSADADPANDVEEDSFWSTVTRLAALGSRALASRLVSARLARTGFGEDWASTAGAAALRLSSNDSAGRHSPLAIADAMLAECPADGDNSAAARADGSWAQWQDTCDAWAEEQPEDQKHRLGRLLKVLSGDVSQIAETCSSWAEMVVATTTYARRVLSDTRYDHGIVEVENACAEASLAFQLPDDVAGGALMDAAVGQPAEAIVRLGASLETTWYAAHLCDLLMQAKQLSPDAASKWMPAPGGVTLHEFLVLEFARTLERNRGTWRIAAEYYTQCPRKGRKALADMLARIPSDGVVDPVMEKVLAFCDANNLPSVRKKVCARIGSEAEHDGNFGAATFWFSRGGHLARVLAVVEAAILNAQTAGPASVAANILAHVVTASATGATNDSIRERVAYARMYADFQAALESAISLDESDEMAVPEERVAAVERAARLAMRLLCGGGLPRRFWATVVYEMCELLESEPEWVGAVSPEVIYELMSALEVICGGAPSRSTQLLEGLYSRLVARAEANNSAALNMEAILDQMRATLLNGSLVSFSQNLNDF
jgi:Nup85 Nucleoporin